MSFIIWFALAVFSVLILATCVKLTFHLDGKVVWFKKLSENHPRISVTVCVCSIIVTACTCIVTFFSPLVYEYPDNNAPPISFDGDRIVKHKWGRFHDIGEVVLRMSNFPITQSSHVQPITENPKVRNIRYTVGTQIVNHELYFKKKYRRSLSMHRGRTQIRQPIPISEIQTIQEDMSQILKRLMISFDDSHSRHLSKFNNHLIDSQQSEFLHLILEVLGPELSPDGIGITRATFTLE